MPPLDRALEIAVLETKAKDFDCLDQLKKVTKTFDEQLRHDENEERREVAISRAEISLKRNDKGTPTDDIDNFLAIMENDPQYAGIRYNVLTNAPEIHKNGKITRWTDANEAHSKRYIESKYHIFSECKHNNALRCFFDAHQFHPIQELFETFKWDGVNRVEHFLTEWAKAEDTPYVREVSRFIFAGGIWRLYQPGCKFDDMPVLIGTKQGEGKSTLVRWLAVNDSYFGEVTTVEGQASIEQLEGAWICEVAELLALTKTKEQEAVKAYLTRQKDKYRRPYDRNPAELNRRCTFIGTTNKEQFLTDKTGNRRFYPVKVNSNGYWLYDHEQECRDYIIQCWAEAKARYEAGAMPNYADKSLYAEYRKAQDNAMEDDYRTGMVEAYLADKEAVCALEIWQCALDNQFSKPTKKDSNEIGLIMQGMDGWEKCPSPRRTNNYGTQRCWVKQTYVQDELPF